MMQTYKRLIAAFLLVFFLFPQIAGNLHYFVVPHQPATDKILEVAKSNPDLPVHFCIFHLQGFSMFLPLKIFQKISANEIFEISVNIDGLELYVHQPDFNFQLRGPPENRKFKSH
ncbi:hypothetical protein LZ575_03175 [Antarcticibacterium sp. 1MA-6-2]|uniref:hypothetical protein n=1 Tax=Antarcticibacterium sp. 1MA-6-2 TaxID=2908210 RepID=UPI001F205BBC|nr:hypothetical protein [Antarcticibacterium sp. 1MA-6-2]UJH91703.1 hypothetical protein LZ575_03175 [Antarcticibacterium sp. 1MA-6-2]